MSGEPYVIFFDGRCRLCRRGRQSILRFGPTSPTHFVDINDPAAVAQYPEMVDADLQGQMYVRTPGGAWAGGFDALVALAPALPAFAWLSPVLRLRPVRAVGRRAYRWVAHNRYRLGGQVPCHNGACAFNPGAGPARRAAAAAPVHTP